PTIIPPHVDSTFRPLFSPCSPAHPVLHSFPTRRSSDLHRPNRVLDGSVGIRPMQIVEIDGIHAEAAQRSIARFVCVLGPSIRSLDRKSTRLNSSHVSISYAVFCLKKKKSNNIK